MLQGLVTAGPLEEARQALGIEEAVLQQQKREMNWQYIAEIHRQREQQELFGMLG
jgi:hypothetical protein